MIIGIIGLGTVGQALAKAFGQVNDVNILLYDKYNNVAYKSLQSTRDDIRKNCDFVFICVPTPTREDGTQDLSELDEVMEWLHPKERDDQIIVIKSTVLPLTTDNYIAEYNDWYICCMPEFLDEKTAIADIIKPRRKPIIGESFPSDEYVYKIHDLFNLIWKNEQLLDVEPIEAEFIKYFTNCYYAMKCLFAHQMQEICNSANVMEIFADNPRIGKDHWKYLSKSKFPLGGKCLPKDLRAFAKWSEEKCTGTDPVIAHPVASMSFGDKCGFEIINCVNIFQMMVSLDDVYKRKYRKEERK
nr:MAG: NADP binding domain protein [Lokiarchaeota virus Ratatoskr Meg22_1012]